MSDTALNLSSIPRNWDIKPLFAVARETATKNVGLMERNLLSLSYGRIVRKDIDTSEGLLPESFEGYQIVQKGDTVLRLTDLQNDKRSLRTGLVHERGIITSAYVGVRPENVEPRFFAHLLYAYDVNKAFYAMGGGLRQGIKFEELRRLPIPLPPLVVQRRIADFLDDQITRIDQTIQLRKRQAELAGVAHQCRRDWTIESLAGSERPLASILAQPVKDGPHETPVFVEDGVPFLSVDSVVSGELSFDECRYISREEHLRFSLKAHPQYGDVLVTKAASIGKVAVVETNREFNVWSPLAILRPRLELIVPQFLAETLRTTRSQTEMLLSSNSSTQNNLSMGTLRRMRVKVPPLVAQHEAVEVLTGQTNALRSLVAVQKRSVELLEERKRSLITEAVTGELDVSTLSSRASSVVLDEAGV